MVDGIGTTTYGYNPIAVPPALGAGQLASIDAPLATDTITLGYDQLGRITNRSINGAANSETWTFDSLGRVSTDVNKLGHVHQHLRRRDQPAEQDGLSGRRVSQLPLFPERAGQTAPADQEPEQHQRADLAVRLHLRCGRDKIKTWTKNYAGLAAPQRFDLGYDNADQLLTAPLKNATTNALIKQYTYGYDLASNRTSELVGTATTTRIRTTSTRSRARAAAKNRTLTYDLNGSITSDGGTRTFEWDGANRLVAINYTGATTRSEFTYDGLSRCAKIVEKTGATDQLHPEIRLVRDREVRVSQCEQRRHAADLSAGPICRAPRPISTPAIISARSAKCLPAAALLLLVMITIPTADRPPCSEQPQPISTSPASIATPRAISIWRLTVPTTPTLADGSVAIQWGLASSPHAVSLREDCIISTDVATAEVRFGRPTLFAYKPRMILYGKQILWGTSPSNPYIYWGPWLPCPPWIREAANIECVSKPRRFLLQRARRALGTDESFLGYYYGVAGVLLLWFQALQG